MGYTKAELEDECLRWKLRFEQEKEAFAAEHAEVERLRAENAGLRGNLKGNPVLSTFDGIASLQNEVERLRAERDSGC